MHSSTLRYKVLHGFVLGHASLSRLASLTPFATTTATDIPAENRQ